MRRVGRESFCGMCVDERQLILLVSKQVSNDEEAFNLHTECVALSGEALAGNKELRNGLEASISDIRKSLPP